MAKQNQPKRIGTYIKKLRVFIFINIDHLYTQFQLKNQITCRRKTFFTPFFCVCNIQAPFKWSTFRCLTGNYENNEDNFTVKECLLARFDFSWGKNEHRKKIMNNHFVRNHFKNVRATFYKVKIADLFLLIGWLGETFQSLTIDGGQGVTTSTDVVVLS